MKNPWRILAIFNFLLSFFFAGLYLYEKSKAPLMIVPPAVASEPGLVLLERTAFVQQFQDRFLNYDQSNYVPNQTALAFTMSEPLRKKHLDDLNAGTLKRSHQFQQVARLHRIYQKQNDLVAVGELHGKEERETWNLNYHLSLNLNTIPRTIENPWGWQVSGLDLQSFAKSNEATHDLKIHAQSPLLLSFPCLVQNVKVPPHAPLRLKLTSLNTSEVQFFKTEGRLPSANIEVLCKDRIFKISLRDQEPDEEYDLFVRYDLENSISSQTEQMQKRRSKVYHRTLEDELGFVVEED